MQSSASRETCHGAAVHPTMPHYRFADLAVALLACLGGPCAAQVSPADTGAPQVQVSRAPGRWILAGKKNVVVLNEADLAVTVEAGRLAVWKMVPSSSRTCWSAKTATSSTFAWPMPSRSGSRRMRPALRQG